MCSTGRDNRYLQLDCSGYVAYVMDTRDKGNTTMDDVSSVWDYTDVFLEDFHGVPPERHVKFYIDMVPGVIPIAKTTYRLAPPEMQELYT